LRKKSTHRSEVFLREKREVEREREPEREREARVLPQAEVGQGPSVLFRTTKERERRVSRCGPESKNALGGPGE